MNPQLQLMLQQAIQAFENGNLDSADLMLKGLLQVDAKNLPALHVLGLIKAGQGRYQESADYLGKAARLNPNDASIQYNLAKALMDCGDDRGALPNHKKAVELNPKNPQAWLNYGKSTFNLGRHDDALSYYDLALRLNPNSYEAWSNKGFVLYALERFTESYQAFERALTLNPNHFEALNNQGIALHALGRYEEALSEYDKALSIKSSYWEALINKGITFHSLKLDNNALLSFDAALNLNPDSPQAWFNRGLLLFSQKNYDEALSDYDKALAINPNYYEAINNKGLVLKHKKRYIEALEHFDLAIKVHPNRYDGHSNRTGLLYDIKEYQAALIQCNIALSLKPNFYEPYNHRGLIFIGLGQHNEAIKNFDIALGLDPNNHEIWNNRGFALHQLNRNAESIEHYNKALSLKLDYYDALWNKSLPLLIEGNYEEGLPLFENRWKSEKVLLNIGGLKKFEAPLWLGQDSLKNKTILIYAEQGLGDYIQLCRYVHLLANEGANVILKVPRVLIKLLENLKNICQVICEGDELPSFDYHCPIMSLPLAFKTTLKSIPHIPNYLNLDIDPGMILQWQTKLGFSKKPLVGLVWSGNISHHNDHNRSIPLKIMLDYLPNQLDYICLQKEIRPSDQSILNSNPHIFNFATDLHDFTDTAALIQCLDLIISVDTSVAHLGGALGIKTLLLLPYAPDWRWLLNREDSPWYPSMKLYRQKEVGDWNGVIDQVASDLNLLFPKNIIINQ
jgi:tetratricopeptide (TPR) repeat protein